MICSNCGSDNISEAKFCYKCGAPFPSYDTAGEYGPFHSSETALQAGPGRVYKTPQDYGYGPFPSYETMAPASPKPKRSKIWIAVIAVVAAAVVAILFVLNPFSREPKNPMAALYDGVKNLLASEGFDINFTYNGDDMGETSLALSVLFGEDVATSVFDYSVTNAEGKDTDYFNRLSYTGKYLISGYWYNWSWYDEEEVEPFDIDDPANYYVEKISSRDVRDMLEDLEDDFSDYYDFSIDINSLISDHRIDSERIIEYGNNFVNSSIMEYDMSLEYILDPLGISRIPDIGEIRSVFEHFFYEKCEEKGFVDQFLTDVKVSGNIYEFTIDLKGMITFLSALEDYLDELERDTKTLSRIGVDESTVRVMRRALRGANRGLREDLDFYYEDAAAEIHVVMELDKDRVLKTLDARVSMDDGYDDYSFEFAVEVTQVNGSKIDPAALDRFAEEIEAYQRRSWDEEPDGTEPVAPEPEEPAKPAEPAAATTYLIGVSISDFDDDNSMALCREIDSFLTSLGTDVEYLVTDSYGDAAIQTSQIENFIAMGADILIINLVEPSSEAYLTKLAEDTGVFVLYIDSEPGEEEMEAFRTELNILLSY